MTRAEIDSVPPDLARAEDFLAQARRFMADADADAVSVTGALVLYYQACISAMDAVLAANGRRVGSGEDSHRVRIAEAHRLLGGGYGELFERLDEWRRERAGVSYAALTPSAALVASMQTDTRDLIGAVDEHLRGRGSAA